MGRSILIVDAETEFALKIAAALREVGHVPRIQPSAAEALRELKTRRPELAIVRAELPDQSGFGLCSTIKREQSLPVILMSSESSAASLAEHATSSPLPADAYLAVPFAMEALFQMVEKLSPPKIPPPIQSPSHSSTTPPPLLPRTQPRDELTSEDRAYLERVFGAISHRRRELLAEAGSYVDKPLPREAVNTPEGRLELLREEVRARDVQIARLSEIWEVREREFMRLEDHRQELLVERAGIQMQLDAERRKAEDALHLASQREKEHGESVDHLLHERFAQEKELIEVVAAKERELGLLRREYDKKKEEVARLEEKVERIDALEALLHQARERILADAERMSVLEEELASTNADRERIEKGLLEEIASLRAAAGEATTPRAAKGRAASAGADSENTKPWDLASDSEVPEVEIHLESEEEEGGGEEMPKQRTGSSDR